MQNNTRAIPTTVTSKLLSVNSFLSLTCTVCHSLSPLTHCLLFLPHSLCSPHIHLLHTFIRTLCQAFPDDVLSRWQTMVESSFDPFLRFCLIQRNFLLQFVIEWVHQTVWKSGGDRVTTQGSADRFRGNNAVSWTFDCPTNVNWLFALQLSHPSLELFWF